MSNEQKNSRTVIEDLPVAEQELTAEEMEKVEGGKTWNETRSNNNVAAALPTIVPQTNAANLNSSKSNTP